MRVGTFAVGVAALVVTAPAAAGPTEDLAALSDRYWAFVMRESPVYASMLGKHEYDDRLGDISLAAEDRRAGEYGRFLSQLDAIPEAGLSSADRVNKAILKRGLEESVEGNRFGQRMMLFTNRSGWHQNLAGLADALTFRGAADYDNYLKRLAAYPALNDEALKISSRALAEGYVLPCVALDGVEQTISGVIPADATKSRLYAPFAAKRPETIAAGDWAALQTRARKLINGDLRAAYARHLAWYSGSYKPKCTASVGISALPGGKEYYNFRIRQYTTTTRTADNIHALGLSEVARIRSEMEKVAKQAGFASREAMIADLRTNPKY